MSLFPVDFKKDSQQLILFENTVNVGKAVHDSGMPSSYFEEGVRPKSEGVFAYNAVFNPNILAFLPDDAVYASAGAGGTAQEGKTLAIYDEAIEAARKIENVEEKIRTLFNLAEKLYSLGEKQKALSLVGETTGLAEQIKDVKVKSRMICDIIVRVNNLGEKEKALALLEEQHEFVMKMKDDEKKSHAVSDLASCFHNLGDKERAKELFKTGIDLSGKDSDALGYAASKVYESGDKEGALKLFDKALNAAVAEEYYGMRAHKVQNIAVKLYKLGEKKTALDTFTKVISYARLAGKKFKETHTEDYCTYRKVDSLISVAVVLYQLGEIEKGGGLFEECSEIARKIEGEHKCTLLGEIAAALHKLGEIEKAAALMDEAVNHLGALKEDYDKFEAVKSLSRSLYQTGETKKGLELLEEAIDIVEKKEPYWRSSKLQELSGPMNLYDHDRAVELLERAAESAEEIKESQSKINKLLFIATRFAFMDETEKAFGVYERICKIAGELEDDTEKSSAVKMIRYVRLARTLKDKERILQLFDKLTALARSIKDNKIRSETLMYLAEEFNNLNEE